MKRSLLLISIQAFSAASAFEVNARSTPHVRKACVGTAATAPLLSFVVPADRTNHAKKFAANKQTSHSVSSCRIDIIDVAQARIRC